MFLGETLCCVIRIETVQKWARKLSDLEISRCQSLWPEMGGIPRCESLAAEGGTPSLPL